MKIKDLDRDALVAKVADYSALGTFVTSVSLVAGGLLLRVWLHILFAAVFAVLGCVYLHARSVLRKPETLRDVFGNPDKEPHPPKALAQARISLRITPVLFLSVLTVYVMVATPVGGIIAGFSQRLPRIFSNSPRTVGGARPYIVLAVAEFEDDDPGRYGVTKRMFEEAYAIQNQIKDIKVIPVGQIIKHNEGSAKAIEIGSKLSADIVVWGGCTANQRSGTVDVTIDITGKRLHPFVRTAHYENTQEIASLEQQSIQHSATTHMRWLVMSSLGAAYLRENQFEKAARLLEQVLALGPIRSQYDMTPDLHSLLGRAYLGIGDYEGALREVGAAGGREKVHGSHITAGLAYAALKKPHAAIQELRLAQASDPDSDIDEPLGCLLVNNGQIEEGISHLARVSQSSPNQQEVLAMIARGYLALGNLPKSVQAMNKARALGASSAYVRAVQAEIYVKQENWPGAITELDRLISEANLPQSTAISTCYLLGLRGKAHLGLYAKTGALENLECFKRDCKEALGRETSASNRKQLLDDLAAVDKIEALRSRPRPQSNP